MKIIATLALIATFFCSCCPVCEQPMPALRDMPDVPVEQPVKVIVTKGGK